MTKAILDITPLTLWAASVGLTIRDAQRIALTTADMAQGSIAGFSLRWSDNIARLGVEATWEPMRQLMGGEFHLMLQPRGDTRSIVHGLKPAAIIWYAATDTETTGLPDYPVAGDLENLMSHISGVGVDGFQHFVKMEPDTSDIKRIRKSELDGVVFGAPRTHNSREQTEDAVAYAERMGLSVSLCASAGDLQHLVETGQPQTVVYIGGDIWFAALRQGASGIASILKHAGL